MRHKRTQGFSLIELIVVMVIIGILAAVIASNVIAHRTVIDEAQLQSVLLQLGQAQERYASSHSNYHSGPATVDAFPKWTGVDLDHIQGTGPGNLGIKVRFVSGDASTYCVEVHHVTNENPTFSLAPGEPIKPLKCSER